MDLVARLFNRDEAAVFLKCFASIMQLRKASFCSFLRYYNEGLSKTTVYASSSFDFRRFPVIDRHFIFLEFCGSERLFRP